MMPLSFGSVLQQECELLRRLSTATESALTCPSRAELLHNFVLLRIGLQTIQFSPCFQEERNKETNDVAAGRPGA